MPHFTLYKIPQVKTKLYAAIPEITQTIRYTITVARLYLHNKDTYYKDICLYNFNTLTLNHILYTISYHNFHINHKPNMTIFYS